MRTPAGAECALYYEDLARGAERRECRAGKSPRGALWRPEDCARCSVPGILAANGSPHLELRIAIRPGIVGLGRSIEVEAWCMLHGPIIADPRVGCPACNAEADEILRRALEEG
jgi:hypothetical protein